MYILVINIINLFNTITIVLSYFLINYLICIDYFLCYSKANLAIQYITTIDYITLILIA